MDIYEPVDWRDTIPVEEIDLAQPRLFRDGMIDRLYTRLREEAPIHYCPESEFGPYWSITRHADIEAVALDASTFSSDIRHGGAAIYSNPGEPLTLPMFLRMDPPDHAVQRGAAAPAFSPAMMQSIEGDLRRRAGAILDGLPINQPIDWVSQVSAELTAMTLATLLDFPQSERHKLIRWSDVVTAMPGGPIVDTMEQKLSELKECFERFIAIWRERERSAPVPDLISMLAHAGRAGPATEREIKGNMTLLIVGGNDTTRSTISGSVVALNRFPEQFERLRNSPGLVASMVPEIMRWQSPIAHVRRTALRDVELRGRRIRAGDKVILWYASGNRDERVFQKADRLDISRPNARRHLAFGHGIHRCVGARLAGLQVRVVWEEILLRFSRIDLIDEPVRSFSTFVNGYDRMTVVLSR